jgi:hypothetical protein
MKVLPLVGTELRSAIIGMVAGDAGIRQHYRCFLTISYIFDFAFNLKSSHSKIINPKSQI